MENVSDSDKIWEEIKNLKMDIFGLPDQFVSQYCKKVDIEPSKCYLTIKVSSVLPSLEAAVGSKYMVDRVDKFITVSYAPRVLG